MVSPSDEVLRCIEEDVFLQEALSRGIVNSIGLARWLIDQGKVRGNEEAIARYIRRFQEAAEPSELASARESLRRASHETRSDRCLLHLKKEPVAVDRLRRLIGKLEVAEGAPFRVIVGNGSLSVVTAAEDLEAVRDELGQGVIDEVLEDLVEIRFSSRGETITTGVLGLVLEGMAIAEVPAVFAHSSRQDQHIFIHRENRDKALAVLSNLLSQ